jgi:hypothetical protein
MADKPKDRIKFPQGTQKKVMAANDLIREIGRNDSPKPNLSPLDRYKLTHGIDP